MAKIKMSSWTYAPVGAIDAERAAKDLKDLGLNCPMSLTYTQGKSDKAEFIRFLDACHEKGMSVFIADDRADFRTLKKIGEEAYRKEVAEMVKDFGSHPATYGFHVGDEPNLEEMEGVASLAVQICNEYAPHVTNFINLLPYCEDFVGADEYGARVSDFIKRSGIKVICYDCYAQCCYFDKEHYRDIYFENLRIFGKAAKENGIELFTSLLSVGHFSLRCPNEDDFRWQISTAIASGVTGIVWFFIYERGLDLSFRVPPVDLFWERTQTFEFLSRQNRTFMQYYAKEFEEDEFLWTKHFGVAYGGFDKFQFDEDIQYLEVAINKSPMQITKLKRPDGRIVYIFVNLNQEEPIFFKMRCGERFKPNTSPYYWLAPGEMMKFVARNIID